MDSTVAAVETFIFLGTTISQDLKWDNHINSIAKKAQQRLYFLRQLRKFNLPQELLKQFYSAIIETVLCSSITVWFGSATKTDIRRLQRTVRTAERIIGAPLPSLQELYTSRVRKRAKKVTLDPSHPAHSLFELLPSGRRYRALSTKTARHKNSFYPQAIPYTPQYCTSVNNSSNLHLYIGHMHIHSSVYGHFSFLYILILLDQMSFICHIHNYTEYNEEWNVFSALNPSKCTHLEQWAADCAAPGEQSWTSCQSQDSNPQPWVSLGFKSDALIRIFLMFNNLYIPFLFSVIYLCYHIY